MKLVEPTKVCANPTCTLDGERQPWSNFYAKVKWDDGTTRQPHSRCKPCHAAAKRANPEPQRRYNRKRYQRNRNDPQAWAAQLEERRFSYHRHHKRERRTHVAHAGGSRLDREPFAKWLRSLGDSSETIAQEVGLASRQVRQYLARERDVLLDVVDRAVLHAGNGTTLEELYPLIEEAA